MAQRGQAQPQAEVFPWDCLVFAMTYVERYDNARVTASQVPWETYGLS